MKLAATHSSFAFALSIAFTVHAAADSRDWQLKKIFNPSSQDLLWEAGDRVFIHDGLRNTDIGRALETQFDLIDTMRFVRTLITDRSGVPLREKTSGHFFIGDDDCD